MRILVIAEHNHQIVSSATLHTISAAQQLGEVTLLLAGDDIHDVVDSTKTIEGVTHILTAEAPYYANSLAEEITPLILSIAQSFSHILVPANAFGKNLLPRICALLDIPQVSDVIKIIDDKTFVHPIYAGNVLQTVQSTTPQVALSIRTTAFEMANTSGGQATIESIAATPAVQLSQFIRHDIHQSDRPELTQARVVVSGGRALGSKEQFEALITPLADTLQAAIGASRAAVDAEYAPNDFQVGQTGKVVAPELYIAVGISGAIQHLAGMQDSKVIVAINKDPDAPIFNVADYGLVADLFDVVPELTKQLKM